MSIVAVEKLSHSPAGMLAAHRAGMILQERGWMIYTPVRWDQPAIIVMDGEKCVAGVNYSEDASDLFVSVDFAWCDPAHPSAFASALVAFRAKVMSGTMREVRFTCHVGNEPMAKAVRVLGLQPVSQSYRMPTSRLKRKAKQAEV